MSILWQFGGYAYPKSVILSQPRAPIESKTRFAETVGRPGQYTQGGLLASRKIVLQGHLQPEPADDMEALWEAFVVAHLPSLPKALYLGNDGRYIMAEVTGTEDTNIIGSGDDFPTSIPWKVSFVASDPFFQAAATTTVNVNAGGTATNAGTVETPPNIEIVLSALGTNGTITLTNTTTTKAIVIGMPASLTTLTIDCARERITNTAGDDVTSLFISGSFWKVAPGNNTITKGTSGGATSSAANMIWRDRWSTSG